MASKKSDKPQESALQQPVSQLPANYPELLDDLKSRIRTAQVKAVLSVNRELIQLYWSIGESIVQRQDEEGWGKAVVQRLSGDLRKEFPDMTGFSASNIWRMRAFYLAWSKEILASPVRETGTHPELAQAVRELDGQSLPKAVAQIPWGHNLALIEKAKAIRTHPLSSFLHIDQLMFLMI